MKNLQFRITSKVFRTGRLIVPGASCHALVNQSRNVSVFLSIIITIHFDKTNSIFLILNFSSIGTYHAGALV